MQPQQDLPKRKGADQFIPRSSQQAAAVLLAMMGVYLTVLYNPVGCCAPDRQIGQQRRGLFSAPCRNCRFRDVEELQLMQPLECGGIL